MNIPGPNAEPPSPAQGPPLSQQRPGQLGLPHRQDLPGKVGEWRQPFGTWGLLISLLCSPLMG